MAMMPMFPLGMVLLPGGILPLHVFEPRYRQMIIDCLQDDGQPEFGQALITHGAEAGGGDERALAGTVAQMIQVEALDEERYGLVAVGTRPNRINAWLPDDTYPVADVDDWPDDEPDPDGLEIAVAAAHARVQAALKMAVELGDVSAESIESEVSDDPLVATYHLASLAPVGPADRYRLLTANGPAARLDVLDDVLDDVEAMLKFRLT
jgi:Lon protease-like protein